ncbi:MAG TPA: Rid family detoxifying hydrolase [Thermoleophilaceae bacterium]|jgi:2-iminobutanoate/2-iminopropanoate deaminase
MPDQRRIIQTDGAPVAVGPYSQAVVVDAPLLYCSGQIPLDPASGELIEGGAGEQTTRCLQNLEAVCKEAGTSLGNAIRVGVFCTDLGGDWADVNAAYEHYFEGGEPPARAAVGVAALPKGARVEIEAVVACPR